MLIINRSIMDKGVAKLQKRETVMKNNEEKIKLIILAAIPISILLSTSIIGYFLYFIMRFLYSIAAR